MSDLNVWKPESNSFSFGSSRATFSETYVLTPNTPNMPNMPNTPNTPNLPNPLTMPVMPNHELKSFTIDYDEIKPEMIKKWEPDWKSPTDAEIASGKRPYFTINENDSVECKIAKSQINKACSEASDDVLSPLHAIRLYAKSTGSMKFARKNHK